MPDFSSIDSSPTQTAESAARDLGAVPTFHRDYTHAHFRNAELAWQFCAWLEARGYRLHLGLPGMADQDVCYSRDAIGAKECAA